MGKEAAASNAEIKVQVRRSGDNELPPPNQSSRRRSTPPPDIRPFRRWTPWLVPSFVMANLVMFAVIMYLNNCPKNHAGECVAVFLGRFAFQPLKENPLFGPSSSTLEKMGALDVRKVVHGHQGWRLISCIWLHAGLIHVLANMLSLILIGIRLEQEFGFAKIGLLYVLSGLGGSLMSALFIKSSISVGASGALFGLLGAMLSELLTNWTIYTNKCAALLTLVLIIAINLAVGVLPHVDNFAHIGGFVAGFLLGFVLLIRPQFGWVSQKSAPPGYRASPVKHKHKLYQYILWIISAILLTLGFTVGLLMLFRGINANDYCSWCHYLSCVPTSIRKCPSSTISCMSSEEGSNLSLTCVGNTRTRTYFFPNATQTQIEELCSRLCS